MDYKKVIKNSIITEKSSVLFDKEAKYVFEVDRLASKGQIKKAIEDIFKVKVLDVATLKNRGKVKRNLTTQKRAFYVSKDTKKAIVRLDSKDSIKLFESKK